MRGALLAVQHQHLEFRGELRGLALPVEHQAGGRDHQAGAVGAAGGFFQMQVGQCLDGLAQPHVIGKNAGEPVFAKELQPV
jgi:hypothetical protein